MLKDQFTSTFKKLLNLRPGTDEVSSIENIKANVDFKSANAWTLVFAIFIASVGLNINSTAVVIGAMLVSPLMGPIVGIGLALGTYDFHLLKRASLNLMIAVVISIVTATIYFLLSPLDAVQSELLARTQPSFFDVMIAFFGGAAGIIAISRKEKGNAIPGVAIATALMPPLCTAGFGLATGHLYYFFGALYLFIINCVFIAASTFIFVRYLNFARVTNPDPDRQKLVNRWMLAIIITTLVPSLALVWFLQLENRFKSQASRFIAIEMNLENSFVVNKKIDYSFKNPKIELTLFGAPLETSKVEFLKERLLAYGLKPEMLKIKQASLADGSNRQLTEKASNENALVQQLQIKLLEQEALLKEQMDLSKNSQNIKNEIYVFLPKIDDIFILDPPPELANSDTAIKVSKIVNVRWKTHPNKSELKKADEFIRTRLNVGGLSVTHSKRIF